MTEFLTTAEVERILISELEKRHPGKNVSVEPVIVEGYSPGCGCCGPIPPKLSGFEVRVEDPE